MLKLCFSSKVRKGTGFVDASEILDEEEEDEDELWLLPVCSKTGVMILVDFHVLG